MQRRTLTAAALIATLGFATTALAQPGPGRGGDHAQQQRAKPQGHPNGGQRAERQQRPDTRRQNPQQHRARPANAHGQQTAQAARQSNQGVRNGRGAGPDRALHRGDRLPSAYRSPQYRVDDWRAHQLPAPPRGHYWVQVGADYVLIAIATGIIASLILAH